MSKSRNKTRAGAGHKQEQNREHDRRRVKLGRLSYVLGSGSSLSDTADGIVAVSLVVSEVYSTDYKALYVRR
jgi:hypothetical protein